MKNPKNRNKYFPYLSAKHTSGHALYALCVITGTLALVIGTYGVELPEPTSFTIQPVKAQEIESVQPSDEFCDLDVVDCLPDGKGGDTEAMEAEAMLKGTPMAGLGGMIVTTASEYGVNWSLIIGIAEAESSRGKHYVHGYDANCHNAWGIKPPGGRRDDGSYLRCYYEWENGVESIAGLLSRRYKDQTPEQMCGVYVQPCNQSWLKNVHKYYQ